MLDGGTLGYSPITESGASPYHRINDDYVYVFVNVLEYPLFFARRAGAYDLVYGGVQVSREGVDAIMKRQRIKRFLAVIFTLALATVFLAACGAQQDDIVLEPDGDGTAPDATEAPAEDVTPAMTDESLDADDDVDEPQSEPPLGDDVVFGEGGIDYLDADETVQQDGAMTDNLITSDVFIGLDLVSGDDVHLGEVVEAFFDMDGNIHYVVLDIEEEALVQFETVLGTDVFAEEVDTIMISTNLINVTAATGGDGDEVGAVSLESPYRLLLLSEFGEGIPFVAQDIDAALLENDQLFLDPERFGLTDRVGEQELLQMTTFETFDLGGHDVVGVEGEDLGDIDELVVDMREGQVAYAVIDVGGFLDMDEPNQVTIPWSQFSFETTDGNFVVDVDAGTLEGAPTVTDSELEDGMFDGSLANDIDNYWENEA